MGLGQRRIALACCWVAMAAEADQDFELELKLLLVGDSGVGKTSILLRFCDDAYSDTFITTIGIDSKTKIVDIDSKRVKARVWDTAGQERFRTISTQYFKSAQGAVLTYDITSRRSFQSVEQWLEQLRAVGDEHSAMVLVANKADLEDHREVAEEEGRDMAASLGLPFFEVSAKDGLNVDAAFEALIRAAIDKGEAALASGGGGGIDLAEPPKPGKGCAC